MSGDEGPFFSWKFIVVIILLCIVTWFVATFLLNTFAVR